MLVPIVSGLKILSAPHGSTLRNPEITWAGRGESERRDGGGASGRKNPRLGGQEERVFLEEDELAAILSQWRWVGPAQEHIVSALCSFKP